MTAANFADEFVTSNETAGLCRPVRLISPANKSQASNVRFSVGSVVGSRPPRCSPVERDRAINALIQFGLEQGAVDHDELQWPTNEAIAVAYQWLKRLDASPPDSVVPNGEGGITLERTSKDKITEKIEISSTGHSEYLRFVNFKLVVRKPASP